MIWEKRFWLKDEKGDADCFWALWVFFCFVFVFTIIYPVQLFSLLHLILIFLISNFSIFSKHHACCVFAFLQNSKSKSRVPSTLACAWQERKTGRCQTFGHFFSLTLIIPCMVMRGTMQSNWMTVQQTAANTCNTSFKTSLFKANF